MEIKSNDSGTDSECSDLKYTDECYDPNVTRRRNSFVWKYFRQVDDSNTFECVICNGCVGHQTSNLARHLAFSHNIKNPTDVLQNSVKRGRPSRSFIWKYCTKQDEKHASCNLCKRVLYFGSGNTENIAKHLRRKHSNRIDPEFVETMSEQDLEAAQAVAAISENFSNNENPKNLGLNVQKERKGGSYIWNYCDKLSRHSIRCNLCNKVMSFHGTANAITHLQRRHNIVGKIDGDRTTLENTVPDLTVEEDHQQPELDEDGNTRQYKRKRSTASSVWKYCTRIGRDVVRCGFCKKNLSYQGTSNLQRHLHRMHGVVTQGRLFKENESDDVNWKNINSDFIWKHCSFVDGDEKMKCNLCNALFDSKDKNIISKHLRQSHGIEPKSNTSVDTSLIDNGDYDDWSKNDYSNDATVFDERNIKKDESVYDDIIEEDPMNSNCDEEPFDPNSFHEFPSANPLSPHSSRASSPIPDYKKLFNSKKMQRLFEEKVRMEAEYFREKAGFYRMQKYLTALQAKKIRVELEQLSNAPNGNLSGTDGYNINITESATMNTQ